MNFGSLQLDLGKDLLETEIEAQPTCVCYKNKIHRRYQHQVFFENFA